MNSHKFTKLAVLLFLVACAAPMCLFGNQTDEVLPRAPVDPGKSSADYLFDDYKAWEANFNKNGGDRNIVVNMGWYGGLSTEASKASATLTLNSVDGIVSVEARGLAKDSSWDVWLIDNGSNSTVLPEQGDAMIKAGTLNLDGEIWKLRTHLGGDLFPDFDPDVYVITHGGMNPTDDRVLVGTTTFFHRLHKSAQRGQFGLLADKDSSESQETSLWSKFLDKLFPSAHAALGIIPEPDDGAGDPLTNLETLINDGRTLFLTQQFNGNGRTCATCHREDNNLTIDPEFIATLPANDPLFVAEFNPNLAQKFENPVLMRQVGLILENLDGFNDLTNVFVMRGVPHTLALLQNTLTPVSGGQDGTTIPPDERTGWSGDGSPVGPFTLGDGLAHQARGTLRDFAIGAVIQHFTKRLNRVPNIDFRLPTNFELDAMNAFQRSTGRREDPILTGPGALVFKGAVPREGSRIFNNPGPEFGGTANGAGRCLLCHVNAGASDFFFPGQNANFNTNVEQLPSQPADLIVPAQPNPPDGGFGRGTPPPGVFGIGNGSFNTPVLVEAADTPPFFHNNSINTIEGAVDFYNSTQFNNPPGFGPNLGGINLEATQVAAVAAMLRVLNAIENIKSAIDLELRARRAKHLSDAVSLLQLSISELEDAIGVLDAAGLHPEAQIKLKRARDLDSQAIATNSRGARVALIDEALALKSAARADMVN